MLYYIADIGANHDGDIKRAFHLIELAKESGASAAKFQHYTADGLVSKKGFSGEQKGHQKNWTKSVWQTYNDASTPIEWTAQLSEHCKKVGIDFFTSPYSFEAVDYIDQFVSQHKIGSGDITYTDLIKHIASKGKPVILGTGAATMIDVMRAVTLLKSHIRLNGTGLVLLQCNTNYTASEENYRNINLNVIKTYQQTFPGVTVGISDHTIGLSTVAGAVALGARVIEKHFTDSRARPGNDHAFATRPDEWREMVNVCEEIRMSLGDGFKVIEHNEIDTVYVQRRGLRYKCDMKAGERLDRDDLVALRPAEGLPPYMIGDILGEMLLKDVAADDPVMRGDITCT